MICIGIIKWFNNKYILPLSSILNDDNTKYRYILMTSKYKNPCQTHW